jgi:hypothetical protein
LESKDIPLKYLITLAKPPTPDSKETRELIQDLIDKGFEI